MADTNRRRPWLAGLLSFLCPGLGELYAGRPQRALVTFAVCQLSLFSFWLIFLPSLGILGLVLPLAIGLGLVVWAVVRGRSAALEADDDFALRPYNRWWRCGVGPRLRARRRIHDRQDPED